MSVLEESIASDMIANISMSALESKKQELSLSNSKEILSKSMLQFFPLSFPNRSSALKLLFSLFSSISLSRVIRMIFSQVVLSIRIDRDFVV